MSASLGVGGALGLPTAAFIADNWDWHHLCWTSAALGVVSLLLVVMFVPESPGRVGGRFDLVGSLGLSAGPVSLLLAVSEGADWGWTSGRTPGPGIAAVVTLAAWGRWELKAEQPLVDPRTTARPQVIFTNLASIALGFSMFAMSPGEADRRRRPTRVSDQVAAAGSGTPVHGGAVVPRTSRVGAASWIRPAPPVPSKRSSRQRAARRPTSWPALSTVVSHRWRSREMLVLS